MNAKLLSALLLTASHAAKRSLQGQTLDVSTGSTTARATMDNVPKVFSSDKIYPHEPSGRFSHPRGDQSINL